MLLLSSSALVALCFTGAASSQTPPNSIRDAASGHPAGVGNARYTQAPQTTPEAPQAAPQTAPALSVPTVTVTAPPRSRTRTARPAAPARVDDTAAASPDTDSNDDAKRDHREPAGCDVAVQPAALPR